MERREDLHRHGCSIAKQTILTTHPSGLQTRVSVELANFDALCVHSECSTKPKRPMWEGSPFLSRRGILGGVSAHGTPVLGRRSDAVNEGRFSQQCTPVMRRREVESPGGSPLPVRRCEEESETEVDNSVISGWLKFRDNKRMNVTTDYQYYIIKIIKELPDPSFPRVICVPRGWIKVTFPDDEGKVVVALPKEDYSVTATRIRSEEHGDWRLFWAHVQDRTNAFDTAINNARVLNEALLHEAQQKEKTSEIEQKNGSKSEDFNESEKIIKENEQEVRADAEKNDSQDEKEFRGFEQDTGSKTEENINKSQSHNQRDSEDNQSYAGTDSVEDEGSEYSDKSWNQSDTDHTDSNTLSRSSSYSYSSSQKNIASESEDSKSSNENGQQHKTESVKSQYDKVTENEEEVRAKEEEKQLENEEELSEIEQENGSKTEVNVNKTQSENQRDSEDNQSNTGTNLVEDIGSAYSEESWNPSDTNETESSETEDDSKEILQKKDKTNDNNQRKRKLKIVDFSVNNKKSRLTNESQIENVATPSTSGEFIKNHKLLSRNELKDTRRKFMKTLASKSNELEKHYIQLDDVLEIIGTILNKITGSFVEAINNVKLMINDENLNCNGSIKHNSGQNTVDQIPKNQRNNFVDENEESVENSDDNDREYTPPNCDAGHSSNSRCSIQTLRDNIDEGSKWTLRHKEFKPQPGLVELLPGGGIYVSSKGLQKCRSFPDNTPNSMARHLLREIFSDEALRRCTLIGGKNSSKPRLDGYARRQLMIYVGQYFSKKNYTIDEEFEKSISKALAKQLWAYSQNKPDRRQFYI